MTFVDYINEMARSTGQNQRGFFSKENDWTNRDERFVKLIKKNINAKHMSLYKLSTNIYVLVDKDGNYLGSIEFEINNLTLNIKTSDSKMKGGFYLVMFSAILTFTSIKRILSDFKISEQAFKSYENLSKGFGLIVKVLTPDNKILEFSKENVFNFEYNRILVTENENSLKESFLRLTERIAEEPRWERMFNERADGLDQHFIYGESINHIKGWDEI